MANTVLKEALPNGKKLANSIAPVNTVIQRHALISVAANPTAADTVDLFWLPKGAIVLGVLLNGTRIDTNASATFAVSLGYAAGVVAAAAPTALLASKVSANSATVDANNRVSAPLAYTALSESLIVRLTYDAVAATFAAGTLSVTVLYETPGAAVS